MTEVDIKIIQKCPYCGFTFERDKKKIRTAFIGNSKNIKDDDFVLQQECSHCHQNVTVGKMWEGIEKTKIYIRNKIVCCELDFMQPDFMVHCVTLFKKKMRFEDIGIIAEYRRTYQWVVKTTVLLDGRVESEINAR